MASLPKDIPAEQLAADLSMSPARRLWSIFRTAKGAVSQGEAFALAEIEPELFFALVDNWSRRGLLLTQLNPIRFIMTEHAKDNAVPPPLPRRPGRTVPTFSGRQRLWAAMRVLKELDLKTLCLAAEAGEKGAVEFIGALARTGYIVALPRQLREDTRYKLVRNTGPKHPVIRRRNEGNCSIVEADDRNDGQLHTHKVIYAPSGMAGKRPFEDGGVG